MKVPGEKFPDKSEREYEPIRKISQLDDSFHCNQVWNFLNKWLSVLWRDVLIVDNNTFAFFN